MTKWLITLGSLLALAITYAKPPNIVWIFSDDHTQQAIGAYGSHLAALDPTPNIDRLAKEGMRFDRCYVGNSICAPSRATLLTGKHSHMNGKLTNGGPFNQNQQTFPKLLQKANFQTIMIGKIHLPGKFQGFDYWEVLPGQGSYYQPTFITENGTTAYEGYVSDIVTDRALEWLKLNRSDEKPFMLMVHHKATHRTWCPAPRHVGLYDDVTIPEPPTLFDDYATRGTAAHEQDMSISITMNMPNDLKVKTREERIQKRASYAQDKSGKLPRGEPGAYYRMTKEQADNWDKAYDPRNDKFLESELEGKDLIRWKYQRYVKDYLRTAKGVDESVGRILDYLDANGLTENTIVFYSSDQGFYLGEHGWFDKRFMYEESYRTPFLARWPGHIKPGSVNKDLIQNIDWAPTFLDLADAPIPDDMQGLSIKPILTDGKVPDDWRKSLYYHYYEYPAVHSVRKHEGVSQERYKLIRFYGKDVPNGEEFEFYDLKTDPQELNNGIDDPANAETIAALKVELKRLRAEYQVPDTPAHGGS